MVCPLLTPGQATGPAGGAVRRSSSDWSALSDRAGGKILWNNRSLSPIAHRPIAGHGRDSQTLVMGNCRLQDELVERK